MVEAFLTNERINQVLLDSLSPEVWRARPPCSKRRNIATTFAHMHNVRCMRLKMSARDEDLPAKLDRAEVTAEEVMASPVVADPLHLLDICATSDGGADAGRGLPNSWPPTRSRCWRRWPSWWQAWPASTASRRPPRSLMHRGW